jgi:hypothetical protein
MQKLLPLLLISIFMAFTTADEGIFSVITSKEDALVNKKFKKFILLDETTGLTLSQKPAIYNESESSPACYFTSHDLSILNNSTRAIAIHVLPEGRTDDYDWVLEHNQEEKSIYFGRSNFIGNKDSMHWIFVIRNDKVLLKNYRSGQFVKLSKNGEFSAVESEKEATNWKLIRKI